MDDPLELPVERDLRSLGAAGALQPQLPHELVERVPEHELSRVGANRFGGDPAENQSRVRAEREADVVMLAFPSMYTQG